MAHDPHNIEIWFDRYRRIIERHGILFDDVWNMDETGFRDGIGRGDKVLALKQGKVYVPSETNRDYTTVVEAVSGRGLSVPPLVILKGREHLARWYTNEVGLETDFLIALSESGYTNDRLHLEWLHHFHRHSVQSLRGKFRLLLLDGFDSHCTRAFLEACDEYNIIPFLLPAHSPPLSPTSGCRGFPTLQAWVLSGCQSGDKRRLWGLQQSWIPTCIKGSPLKGFKGQHHSWRLSTLWVDPL